MTVAEIIILIVGAILFTVSFFLNGNEDDYEGGEGLSREAAQSAVKDAIAAELKNIKSTIDEATEESISDSKDKMERYMDRLTNEKMMAVSEYSDTVLEQIHKDHDEAVFLYDMIDSKYNQVKNTAAEINQIEKSVRKLKEQTPVTASAPVVENKETANNTVSAVDEMVKSPEESAVDFSTLDAPVVETTDEPKKAAAPKKRKTKSETKKAEVSDIPAEPIANSDVELMFDSDSNSMNSNDRILALHKEGKSNMAIAKELGLGVGEVKLVIDLFKSF